LKFEYDEEFPMKVSDLR